MIKSKSGNQWNYIIERRTHTQYDVLFVRKKKCVPSLRVYD